MAACCEICGGEKLGGSGACPPLRRRSLLRLPVSQCANVAELVGFEAFILDRAAGELRFNKHYLQQAKEVAIEAAIDIRHLLRPPPPEKKKFGAELAREKRRKAKEEKERKAKAGAGSAGSSRRAPADRACCLPCRACRGNRLGSTRRSLIVPKPRAPAVS